VLTKPPVKFSLCHCKWIGDTQSRSGLQTTWRAQTGRRAKFRAGGVKRPPHVAVEDVGVSREVFEAAHSDDAMLGW